MLDSWADWANDQLAKAKVAWCVVVVLAGYVGYDLSGVVEVDSPTDDTEQTENVNPGY